VYTFRQRLSLEKDIANTNSFFITALLIWKLELCWGSASFFSAIIFRIPIILQDWCILSVFSVSGFEGKTEMDIGCATW